MPSAYGTIPTASTAASSSSTTFVTRAQTSIALLRPWRDLFDPTAFSRPYSYHESSTRLRTNLYHFRINYTLIVLVIIFLSLIYHPISMIVFLSIFVLWYFLYFSRNYPLVFMGREIDDRLILGFLSVLTVLSLVMFTGVGWNVLAALGVGFVLVSVHAVFRGTDDLYVEEGEDGLLKSVVGSSMIRGYGEIL